MPRKRKRKRTRITPEIEKMIVLRKHGAEVINNQFVPSCFNIYKYTS